MPGPQLIHANVCPLPIAELWGFTWAGDLAHISKLFLNNLALITKVYIFIFLCTRPTFNSDACEKWATCALLWPTTNAYCSVQFSLLAPLRLHWAWGVELGFRPPYSLCGWEVDGLELWFRLCFFINMRSDTCPKWLSETFSSMWRLRHSSSSAYRVL